MGDPGSANGSQSAERIIRIDVTDLSWSTLGPVGRLYGRIRRTPTVGRVFMRTLCCVFAIGAGAGILDAAARFVLPVTTHKVERFVEASWLFKGYLLAFAAVGLSWMAYTLLSAYNVFFQSAFSLRRNRLLAAGLVHRCERLVPYYDVPLSQVWRQLYALQLDLGRDAGKHYRRRIFRSRAALVLSIVLFVALFVHWDREANSESYRAILRAFPWIKILFAPVLAGGMFFLAEYFRLRRPEAQSRAVRMRARRFRVAAVCVLFLPVVYNALIGHTMVDDRLPGPLQLIVALVVIPGWVGGAWYLFYRANLTMDARVTDVRSADGRGTVVLFRSFVDDSLMIVRAFEEGEETDRDDAGVIRGVPSSGVVAFEAMIEQQVRDYAPLIAVGQPGVIRRGLATRDYFTHDQWKDVVIQWMADARFIVVIAAWTPGLRWELRNIVTRGHMGKLILLIPPGPHRAERWRFLADCFASSPWHEWLLNAEHEHVLAVHWTPEGKAIFLCSEHGGDRDYEVALHLAIYGLRIAPSATALGVAT